MFLHNYSFNNSVRQEREHRGSGNIGPIGSSQAVMPGIQAGFSVDDGGMDEYDVADERAHLFEYINPDNMTYEELLALQERIG